MNPRDKVFATTSLALDMSLVEDRDGQDGSWVTQDVGEGLLRWGLVQPFCIKIA